jgi:hypothetical protein
MTAVNTVMIDVGQLVGWCKSTPMLKAPGFSD